MSPSIEQPFLTINLHLLSPPIRKKIEIQVYPPVHTIRAIIHSVHNTQMANDITRVPKETSAELITRIRALPSTTSPSERDTLVDNFRRARSFEALVKTHGSEHAARAVLAEHADRAAAAREREISSMLGPSPNRLPPRPDPEHQEE